MAAGNSEKTLLQSGPIFPILRASGVNRRGLRGEVVPDRPAWAERGCQVGRCPQGDGLAVKESGGGAYIPAAAGGSLSEGGGPVLTDCMDSYLGLRG